MGAGASGDQTSPSTNENNPRGNRSRNRNPRYLVNMRDEPKQMLNPIEGYQQEPLLTLEKSCQPLENFIPNLQRQIRIAKINCRNPSDNLTIDESAAIQLYTMEWETSLYHSLNQQLRRSDRRRLKPWFSYLKLFLTALYKLPSYRGTVWRGVSDDLTDQYEQNTETIWWGLSSCTRTMAVLENPLYLGNRGPRTLFGIETTRGKSIEKHSFYQNEDEILLLPGTNLEVTSHLNPGNHLHIIQLREKRPAFSLLQSPFQPKTTDDSFHRKKNGKLAAQLPPLAAIPAAVPTPTPLGKTPVINPLNPQNKRRKIWFHNIPGAGRNQDRIPDGYEGFNWENFVYVEESYAQSNLTNRWKNVFKHSRFGIYNYGGNQMMYIKSAKSKRLFSLISIDATVVDRSNCQWELTGFRDNLKIYSKQINFSDAGKYQFVQLNFDSIDEVKFTIFSGYPELLIGMIEVEG